MSLYQGRALRSEPRRRGRGGRLRRILTLLFVITALPVVTQAPWAAWRGQLFPVRAVRVEGTRYLETPAVLAAIAIRPGMDLFGVDLDRARQTLLLHPRIAGAAVERVLPGDIRVRIEERVPVLLVGHGAPWELDSTGVLLPPLADGVVADVPMLVGPDVATLRGGTHVNSPDVARGLAWARAIAANELELAGRISEIDVSEQRSTALTLMSGTRVLSPAWPPGVRTLSALRVVLADLQKREIVPEQIDLRFDGQVIVRPVQEKAGDLPKTS